MISREAAPRVDEEDAGAPPEEAPFTVVPLYDSDGGEDVVPLEARGALRRGGVLVKGPLGGCRGDELPAGNGLVVDMGHGYPQGGLTWPIRGGPAGRLHSQIRTRTHLAQLVIEE